MTARAPVAWARDRLAGAARRARRGAGPGLATADRAINGFFGDGAPQSAAAISYYALFSLFPLAIVIVAAFAFVIDDSAARARVIDLALDHVPLREDRGRRELEELLTSVTRDRPAFGVAGAVGLVVAGSAVMGAIRHALNRAWDVEDPRPPAQGKLLDVLLVLGLGLLVALSFALTLVARLTVSLSAELEQALGPVGSAVPRLLLELGPVVPSLVAFAAFAILFRVVPATRTRLRDVWPGAALAAVGFEAANIGFAIYLETFANYSAVYASLAAVVAFLVFVFVTANVLLLGAQVAVAWPEVRDGAAGDEGGGGAPLGERVRRTIAGLFVRVPDEPDGQDEPDKSSRERTRDRASGS